MFLCNTLSNNLKYILNYPTIQLTHQTIALGCGNETVRQNHPPGFIMQTQQNLDMPTVVVTRLERSDFLGVQTKTVFFQGHVQALHPGHLTKAQGQFGIVSVIDLHAVTALFLGHVTGHICGTQ
ncbi:hypothetical protein D3C87_903940 [compost metagenome]